MAAQEQAHVSGKRGEDIAAEYLENKGYVILARNVHLREEGFKGEIDIIAVDPAENTLAFVEVKYRATELDGGGVAALSPAQLKRIRKGAYVWLARQVSKAWRGIRIDVIDVGPERVRMHLIDVW